MYYMLITLTTVVKFSWSMHSSSRETKFTLYSWMILKDKYIPRLREEDILLLISMKMIMLLSLILEHYTALSCALIYN